MYFKRLEIFGFKSFADKTVLNFEPGITAIVGPNGCGKSNIFDAVRWVLGEQSVKELRGGAMEDVIFNGTDKKPGLGFAEVDLTFSNETRSLPLDFNEVTVTRRLFRSGESEYLINKSPARLKDILELFMGTGIGSEAYSLVQQGKVDLVVNARPEDRRNLLDEASGITKYKSKRKEALSKLEDTDNNLLRLNDIITEVKRQISSLERQANKARRYKDELEKLKGLEVVFARHELSSLDEKRQALDARLKDLQADETRMNEELQSLNGRMGFESQLLEEVEARMNDVHSEDIKLESQIDISQRQIGFNQERLQDLDSNEKRLNEKKEQMTLRSLTQKEKIAEVQKALQLVEETSRKKQEQLLERQRHLEELAVCIKAAQVAIRQEEEKILGITTSQVQVKNRLTEVMKEIQGSLARKRRLEMENAKVGQEKIQIDARTNEMARNIEDTKAKINGIRSHQETEQATILHMTQELDLLVKAIDELEKKKLFFRSQKDFIEKMSAQYQDIPDPVVEGRLYTDTAPSDHHTGIIGKVRGVTPLDPARQNAFQDVFPSGTKQFYEVVCEAKFIELDPLEISRRIDDLSAEILVKNQERDQKIHLLQGQKAVMTELEGNIQEQEKNLSVLEAQQHDVLEEAAKLDEELSLVGIELQEVTDLLASLKLSEEGFLRQLDGLNRELESSQTRIKNSQESISAKSQEKEETTVTIAQLQTELESLLDKKRDHGENLAVFSADLEQTLNELGTMDREFLELKEKRKQFLEAIEGLNAKIADLQREKESLVERLNQDERLKSEQVSKMESLRANMIACNRDLEGVRTSMHNEQMTSQQLLFKVKEIKDRLQQTYRIDLDAMAQETAAPDQGELQQAQPETAVENTEEIIAQIDRLKKRCEAFGSVNLVAIEEFEELKTRFEFLTKQQSDLLTAKESLHETIRKINRQTRQMFLDTFTKVSEEFRIYYRMLFGGGDAQLVLQDPENVLESGIEIIARPPGKKLQNISLLSGGEKTLTAIALIFGVFKVNPSPFCVLDEIDAALDESNVGRFSYLLKDFAKIAQFIVITHNKKTIASADVMYGITMQETGVSKIVSVKFADQADKQAVPAGV